MSEPQSAEWHLRRLVAYFDDVTTAVERLREAIEEAIADLEAEVAVGVGPPTVAELVASMGMGQTSPAVAPLPSVTVSGERPRRLPGVGAPCVECGRWGEAHTLGCSRPFRSRD